jgi:GTP 3',8-cyclase
MKDQYGRNIVYARISVTDRCNLRCRYCMPAEGVQSLPHSTVLSYEEILRVAGCLAKLGITKLRITGGEPLVRKGIVDFVRRLKSVPGIEKVMLTTNGVALAELAKPLVAAGLDGVNMSLDTFDAERFASITRRDMLPKVREGLCKLLESGCREVKLNIVPLAGINEADFAEIAELARVHPIRVRFIELMPIGCAAASGYKGLAMAQVRDILEEKFGALLPQLSRQQTGGPASYYSIDGFQGQIGFIDALEHQFCSSCNRVRFTADGFLKLCLNSSAGLDVRQLLRDGADDRLLCESIEQAIYQKPAEHFFAQTGNTMRDTRKMYEVGG